MIALRLLQCGQVSTPRCQVNDMTFTYPRTLDEEEEQDPEALLNKHDLEVARLKDEKRSKVHILQFVKKYFELLDDERALAVCVFTL